MTSFFDQLQSFVGRTGAPQIARDPVNEAMIRHWCDAMGDDNPVYTDPEFAARSRKGGIVAPPTMLDVWDKHGLKAKRDTNAPQGAVLSFLDDNGFVSVVAVNSELEFTRDVRPGELLRATQTLDSVSEEKQTGLGVGHFVTSKYVHTNQDGEVVGNSFFRVLKFRPGTGRPAPESTGAAGVAPPNPRPATPPVYPVPQRRLTTRTRGEVAVGDELPTFPIYLTPTLIVSAAIATRDFAEVHHDRDLSRERGSQDIFMNIHTGLGLAQRWINDWAGPEADWKSIRVRLGTQNLPYDTMTMTGSVTAVDPTDGRVGIGFVGKNSFGAHVTGTAELVLPA